MSKKAPEIGTNGNTRVQIECSPTDMSTLEDVKKGLDVKSNSEAIRRSVRLMRVLLGSELHKNGVIDITINDTGENIKFII